MSRLIGIVMRLLIVVGLLLMFGTLGIIVTDPRVDPPAAAATGITGAGMLLAGILGLLCQRTLSR